MMQRQDEYMQDALETIKYFKSIRILEKGPAWVRLWLTLKLEWSVGHPQYITMPLSSDERLANSARAHPAAFELSKTVIASRMRAGVDLAENLRELIVDWIEGNLQSPNVKRGPPISKNWGRDIIICHIMYILKDRYGVDPTSSDTSAGTLASGSVIAHEALMCAGLRPPSVARIQNIATSRNKLESYEEVRGLLLIDEFDDLEPESRI